MGEAISQDEIGRDNLMEGWLARAWLAIEKNLVEKESRRIALGWAAGVVGMLKMVHSQWKYRCNIVHLKKIWLTD